MGIRCLDLSDASPTVTVPRRGRGRDLRCYPRGRTTVPNPHAPRLGVDATEAAYEGAGAPIGIGPDGRARNHEPRLLPERQLGRRGEQKGAPAVPTGDLESHGHEQL